MCQQILDSSPNLYTRRANLGGRQDKAAVACIAQLNCEGVFDFARKWEKVKGVQKKKEKTTYETS